MRGPAPSYRMAKPGHEAHDRSLPYPRHMNIPITKVVFGEEERRAVQQPLETGWVVQGPQVESFEKKFARFTGSPHAIACTSCTAALHMSLAALDIQPGQEVIVPAFTWISTANVIEYLGATPVFVDIDLETYNIDPDAFEAAITPRTRAVIPVHLFGLSADMDPILEISEANDLLVVEDAACGFGSFYHGTHVGTFGDFGCFSFHPRKAITSGEGGMVVTSEDDRAALCRTLRNHGASRSDLSGHEEELGFLLSTYDHLGYNYRMTDLQGAVANVQMDRADWILNHRIERAARYHDLLQDLPWLETPYVPTNCRHTYQSYVCLFTPEPPSLDNLDRLHGQRNELMRKLDQRGIATRQGTHAVTLQGYYQQTYALNDRDYPNALIADRLTISLPLYPQMTDEEQDYVVSNLREAYREIKNMSTTVGTDV